MYHALEPGIVRNVGCGEPIIRVDRAGASPILAQNRALSLQLPGIAERKLDAMTTADEQCGRCLLLAAQNIRQRGLCGRRAEKRLQTEFLALPRARVVAAQR